MLPSHLKPMEKVFMITTQKKWYFVPEEETARCFLF